MNVEEVRTYCLSLRKVTEDSPFGPQTLVMRVGNKMFALIPLDKVGSINLKCDPERAILLREEFNGIKPGWHMNKTHWNTVILDGSLPDGDIERMIDNSYKLVVRGLPKKVRLGLKVRHGQQA
jgi:predicted DNA-binding protein (MmcQ/YjbR family)